MAAITVAPKVFKNYTLTVGADNYEAHVNAVTMTPSSSIQTWKGADGTTYSDAGTASWTCQLDYAQDWTTANSLALYLLNNEGDSVEIELTPLGTGPSFTTTVTILPGQIGGAIDAYGTGSVTMPASRPVYAAGV